MVGTQDLRKKLHARVALVTGGQRGLGAAMLQELAAEGATCIVNYPAASERAEAEALVEHLASTGEPVAQSPLGTSG